MKIADFIIISFKNIDYKINTKKLEAVLSYLENRNIVIQNKKQVSELLEKYKLYDEGFLENINKI